MFRLHALLLTIACVIVIIVLLVPETSTSQGTKHSLLLNGTSSYVSVSNSSTINISGPITIEAWIKLNAINGNYQDTVCREAWGQAGTGGGYEFAITNTGKLRLDLYQSHNQYTTAIGGTTVSTNTWHHVAGVFDGSQIRVYLDGQLDGSLSTTNGPASGTSALNIGKSTYTTYYFGGLIDEVRISAAALYSSNFTSGLGPASNTRALWRFDGQTTNDSSGNGNHGTLHSGATYSTDVPTTSNNAPTVTLTDPLSGTTFSSGSTIVIDATATDSDGVVSKVDFYQGTTLLGTDTSTPYTFAWNNVPGGAYSLTAKATDDNGAVTTSSAVTINVLDSLSFHSLSLNGTSSYVSVPNSSTINISGPITVEAWIKLNSINGNYQDIVCREAWGQAGTGGGYEFAITSTGKLRLDLYQSHNQYTTAIGSTTVTTNTWHHVAGVFDGSQMRVYLDGVLDGSLSTTNGPASGTSVLNIGKSTYTTYYFGGLIDEVRISAAALYSNNFTPGLGPGSNTRALWKFDGQTTNDSSGNGNHGTVQSGATYSTNVPSTDGSQRPVPVAGGPYTGQLGQGINFSSSGSFDPDGTISSYHWNFGDGTSANTQNPSHSYQTSGLFTATLTVTDNAGLRASATAAVTIGGTSEARLDPMNETGGGGDNPLSRNFNWTQDLLNLPGRSGMDLNLTLSYNSLVWTKNGSFISFDDDRGFPSPGFRLGFPVIQPRHLNPETGKNGHLLIGSDGSRTELRQLSTSQTLFESADSSHILLDTSFSLPAPNNDKLVLRTTDGMRMLYALKGVDYQCTEIKDRNGNYITINYTAAGKIDTIIDTLNREIKFNYYANGLLEKITQVWKKGTANERTHIWAYFEYTGKEIQTAFTDLTVVGAANGSEPKLLTKVTLADNSTTISNNSRVEFNYTSWGQVHKVSNLAPDGHPLSYRSYNLPLTSSPAQTDCPRFTERRDWAENWNRGGGLGASGLPAGTEQEVLTTYAIPNIENDDEWTMPDGNPQSGTRTQVTVADGTSDEVTNEIYYIGKKNNPDGWQRKLPALVNTYDQDNVLRRQVMTKWTQDVTDISYELNPRIEETNIYDPSSLRKRTRIIYELTTLPDNTTCQLPKDFIEYAADASTVLRSTRTEYEDDNAYLTRRIIGLVSKKSLYAGDVNGTGSTLMSQVELLYDGENSIEGSELPVQHDNSAYSNTFVLGRANVTTLKRYDVTDTSKFTTTTNKYNRAGSLTSSKNKLNHEVTFSYTDAFASVGNTLDAARSFSTYAYPTTVNDPDEFSTRKRYDYDFGSKTWEQTPPPNQLTNVSGPQRTYTYDEMGRLERTTSLVNNAFTRYKYGSNYIETFSSVNSTTEMANEGHLLEVFDGLGRVIATAHDHPGHTGHFGAKLVLYDRLGRAIKRSNPTETDISIAGTPINPYQFTALGDDTVAGGGFGWKYTIQTYDWKGRPLVTTNTDGTTIEASYSSCGCAGSLVTTVSDEGTLVGGVIKRRQKKIYTDVLDRTIKTESLDWDGNVYATTVNSYDVRDQVTQVRQYEGSQGSYQDTTFEYDGFGRLHKRHLPQQQADPNNQDSTDHTTWTYNDDDTVNTIKDARGAVTAYGYAGTKRGLLKSVTYTQPGSEISITYTYDAAGNRKKMIDPLGITDYTYDSLSRLQSESREIIDSGFSGSGSYALTYGYNLADELTSITDPFQASINYSYNSATGHLTGVTGSSFQGVTEYSSQMSYRAWGGLKSSVVGTTNSNRQISQKYNERLQVTEFKLLQGLNIVLGKQYTYGNATTGNNDGRVKYTKDLRAEQLDRGYKYDHRGRITFAKSGIEARRVVDPANTLNRPLMDGPYDQAFGYDAFDHMNNRTWRYFFTHYTGATMPGNAGSAATYTNNRKQGWLYDSEGNVTQPGPDTTWQYTYNAAGQIVNSTVPGRTILYGYDGDGRLLKETINGTRTYYLTSSLLGGQTVTELSSAGQKKATYVYQGQQILAKQEGTKVLWLQADPAGASKVWIDQNGSITDRIELDALGSQTGNSGYIFYSWEEAFGTGIYNYYQYQQQQYYSLMAGSPGSTVADSVNNAYRSCTLDGGTVPCEVAMGMANRGGATINWRNPGNGIEEFAREGILEPIIDKWTSPLLNVWDPDYPPHGPTPPYSFSYISGYRFRTSPDLPATQGPTQNPTPMDKLLSRAQLLNAQPDRNDCHALVDLIRYAANNFDDVIDAVNALGVTLAGASVPEFIRYALLGGERPRPRVVFGSVGFRENLRAGTDDNQVEHFIGGFIAGSVTGDHAFKSMYKREKEALMGQDYDQTHHAWVDLNLNDISIPLGKELQDYKLNYLRNTGAGFLNSIADKVKERVCK